jgi:hypothetical protein
VPRTGINDLAQDTVPVGGDASGAAQEMEMSVSRRRVVAGLFGGAATLLAVSCQAQLPARPMPAVAPEPVAPAPPVAAPPAPRIAAPPVAQPAAPVAAPLPRRTLADLLSAIGAEREVFETVEERFFAGLRERLATTDRVDQDTFDEALRRFQRSRGLPASGLPDEATVAALQIDSRDEVTRRYRALGAAAKELGVTLPDALDQSGLAFDLPPRSGMQERERDAFLVTQEGAGWRVWARTERGQEKLLPAVLWQAGKPVVREQKASVVDFTALAEKHGFRGVGTLAGFPGTYESAGWWRFQCEAALTPFLSQLGGQRFLFDRDRGTWRFGQVGAAITPEESARYYGAVADEIRRTLRDYQAITVAVPANDPLRGETGETTEVVVRTPYWIYDGEDAEKRAKNVKLAHADLQAAFKAAPLNGRVAKGSPAEIKATIEGALRTGRIRAADGAWPPKREDVEAWMHDFGVGVDCSGFVYEALTRVEKALMARSMGRLAVARLGPPTEVSSRQSKQGHRVGRASDLSVGDLMFRPPQANNPISHVRIVESVEHTAEGVVFTTAESTFDVDGQRALRWRFRDAAALSELEWHVDGRWQRAQEREQPATYWRHLPLMRAGLTRVV